MLVDAMRRSIELRARVELEAATAKHGHAFVGMAIGAVLAAIGAWLSREVGPEAAFNTFTRAADAVIAPRLQGTPQAES